MFQIPGCSRLRLHAYLSAPLFLFLFLAGTAYRPVRILSTEMLQFRQEITTYASSFVGTPYRYAGYAPETGFDCSGFTSFVLKKFDAELSRSSSWQARQGTRVPLAEVLPGDLLFFGRQGRIQHVALVVEHAANGIICAHSTRRGVVVENVNTSSYWKPRILFARDVLGQRDW
ncbi:MAG: NlpC/P60 family protein [Bacteroidetes bacterium]|nr:MAG: NlpC/P60 family protein [Bacteroidota bacterium]